MRVLEYIFSEWLIRPEKKKEICFDVCTKNIYIMSSFYVNDRIIETS